VGERASPWASEHSRGRAIMPMSGLLRKHPSPSGASSRASSTGERAGRRPSGLVAGRGGRPASRRACTRARSYTARRRALARRVPHHAGARSLRRQLRRSRVHERSSTTAGETAHCAGGSAGGMGSRKFATALAVDVSSPSSVVAARTAHVLHRSFSTPRSSRPSSSPRKPCFSSQRVTSAARGWVGRTML
jgi:hypothetical protein